MFLQILVAVASDAIEAGCMPPIALAAVSYICYWSPQRASNPPLLEFVPVNSDFMTTQNHKTAIGTLRGL